MRHEHTPTNTSSVSSPALAAHAQLTARLVMDDSPSLCVCVSTGLLRAQHVCGNRTSRSISPNYSLPTIFRPFPLSPAFPGPRLGSKDGVGRPDRCNLPPIGDGILRLRGSPGCRRGGGHHRPRLLSRGNRHYYSCDLQAFFPLGNQRTPQLHTANPGCNMITYGLFTLSQNPPKKDWKARGTNILQCFAVSVRIFSFGKID